MVHNTMVLTVAQELLNTVDLTCRILDEKEQHKIRWKRSICERVQNALLYICCAHALLAPATYKYRNLALPVLQATLYYTVWKYAYILGLLLTATADSAACYLLCILCRWPTLSTVLTNCCIGYSYCSVSRWRPQKVDKRMVLEYTHGLFIT
jgi:hypothetical protein